MYSLATGHQKRHETKSENKKELNRWQGSGLELQLHELSTGQVN